jgi:hypothetical protein
MKEAIKRAEGERDLEAVTATSSEGGPFGGVPVMELADEFARRNFLKWAAIVGAGATLVVTTKDRFAAAQSADVDILNYALTLEYLEQDFFARGSRSGVLTGRDGDLIAAIGDAESEHVSALSSTVKDLGGTPVPKPKLKYPKGVFRDRAAFLKTAAQLEDLAVKAYHGQVTRIGDPAILGAAASIAGAESRHAAICAELSGEDPFPAPIEQALKQARVLKAARPFLRS